jgi:hypothetical protein
MQSALGWTVLSREALRRAESHLRDQDQQGVRDEIGFLSLHQAYADRFFPGTSVLQTRLRYVLFVPWIYQDAAEDREHQQINRAVQAQELDLAKRLKRHHGMSDGVIGARSLPKHTSQPPSMVYWNALGTWGILRPWADGTYPGRAAVHRALGKQPPLKSQLRDDDKAPLEENPTFFVNVPTPPAEWHKQSLPLDLTLRPKEAVFIRQHLVSVQRSNMPGTPSLLAYLVEHNVDVQNMASPWGNPILNIVDKDERAALLHSQQTAALAAIGRAVYAALVERICHEEDKRPMPNAHRDNLNQVIKDYRKTALKLEVTAVASDAPYPLPSSILNILSETQNWLKSSKDIFDLRSLYEQAEVSRKGRRARLSRTLAGQERRNEWVPDEHPGASPLHYRWSNVQRLLNDLRNHG